MCVCVFVCVCVTYLRTCGSQEANIVNNSPIWNRSLPAEWSKICFSPPLTLDRHFQGKSFGILLDMRISRKRGEIEQAQISPLDKESAFSFSQY